MTRGAFLAEYISYSRSARAGDLHNARRSRIDFGAARIFNTR
jgi:hypothetical protein